MNVNEVISNRCIQMVGGTLGAQESVHPNDHVNMSQSSNDTFPTATHIAAVKEINETLLPKVSALVRRIEDKAKRWQHVVKIGRTHLEDAVPLTVGQEWSGYAVQIRNALARPHRGIPLRTVSTGGRRYCGRYGPERTAEF
jgi:fumarate hydratase class II